MSKPILVAGLDGRSLLLEASVLHRDNHEVQETLSARALLEALSGSEARLVVLGPHLGGMTLPELVTRIREGSQTRRVSILVLLPAGEPSGLDGEILKAGANAVLRRPLDPARLDAWLSKLLAVPSRVQARVPVSGKVVGTPRTAGSGHFLGLTLNLSMNGMLLASPVRLNPSSDIDLELDIPSPKVRLKALGRVIREAPEVRWPYMGYGIEFLYLPDESFTTLFGMFDGRGPSPRQGIHSTLRREAWVFEILQPVPRGSFWHVEILRAPKEQWRPGKAGPFYVVEGSSREEALSRARDFVVRHG